MQQPAYHTLEEYIELLPEPNRDAASRLWHDHEELFENAKGSGSKHQAWQGGYRDHVTEACNIAQLLYTPMQSTGRPLSFSLEDAVLVLFLHDIEKPFKQAKIVPRLEHNGAKDKTVIAAFKEDLIKKYNFALNEQHWNALHYAEGEGDDYDPQKRVMGPLAAFVHTCDVISARIYHEHPGVHDMWEGAHRRTVERRQ